MLQSETFQIYEEVGAKEAMEELVLVLGLAIIEPAGDQLMAMTAHMSEIITMAAAIDEMIIWEEVIEGNPVDHRITVVLFQLDRVATVTMEDHLLLHSHTINHPTFQIFPMVRMVDSLCDRRLTLPHHQWTFGNQSQETSMADLQCHQILGQ